MYCGLSVFVSAIVLSQQPAHPDVVARFAEPDVRFRRRSGGLPPVRATYRSVGSLAARYLVSRPWRGGR